MVNYEMNEFEISLLFDALGKILYNQEKIMRHLGVNKYDPNLGYDDSTETLADRCYYIAGNYEQNLNINVGGDKTE